ncbi:hypothetical protein ACFLUG_00935 [Chloroflexota bacterium]
MMRQPRGEPLCPRCGSADLTYKNVFDYYKCNDCRITFITPVYSYGDINGQGIDSAKDIASKIFGGAQPTVVEEKVEEPKPAAPARSKPAAGNRPWMAFALIICILIILALTAWIFFSDQLAVFFSDIVQMGSEPLPIPN